MRSWVSLLILGVGLIFSLNACREGGTGLPGINVDAVQFSNFSDGSLQLETVGSELRAMTSLSLSGSNVNGLAISNSVDLFTLSWDPDTENEGENQQWIERPNAFGASYSELKTYSFDGQLVLAVIQRSPHRVRLFNVAEDASLTFRTDSTVTAQSLTDFGIVNSRSLLGLTTSGTHPIWNAATGGAQINPIPGNVLFASPIRTLVENFRNRREDPENLNSSFLRDFILVGQNSIGLLHQDGAQSFRGLEEVNFGAGVVAQDAISIDLDNTGRPGILLATNQGLRYYRNISTPTNLIFELTSLNGSAAASLTDVKRLRSVQTDPNSLRDVLVLRENGSLVYFRTTAARSLTDQTSSVLPASLPISGSIVDVTPLFFSSVGAHDLALVTSTGQIFTLIRNDEDD